MDVMTAEICRLRGQAELTSNDELARVAEKQARILELARHFLDEKAFEIGIDVS